MCYMFGTRVFNIKAIFPISLLINNIRPVIGGIYIDRVYKEWSDPKYIKAQIILYIYTTSVPSLEVYI